MSCVLEHSVTVVNLEFDRLKLLRICLCVEVRACKVKEWQMKVGCLRKLGLGDDCDDTKP